MNRNKNTDRHPDSVNLTAYGQDWGEIQDDARRIACMPGGHVTMTHLNSSLYNEYEYPEKGKAVKTGRLYAFVNVAPAYGEPAPAPGEGVEYYSPDDILRALQDMNYYGAETIITEIRRRLAVRNDGRYTLDELKRAIRQLDPSSGSWNADRMDQWALQARKNRVWEANGGT